MVGPATAAKLGVSLSGSVTASSTSSSGGYSSSDVTLLARLVYAEARGEPYKGQVAVAAVVLNRVRSSEFPNTIAGVIYQKNAFSCVSDGQINLTPNAESKARCTGCVGRLGPRRAGAFTTIIQHRVRLMDIQPHYGHGDRQSPLRRVGGGA